MFSTIDSKVDTNFQPFLLSNTKLLRKAQHVWSTFEKLLISFLTILIKNTKKHLFETVFTWVVYISLYFLQ